MGWIRRKLIPDPETWLKKHLIQIFDHDFMYNIDRIGYRFFIYLGATFVYREYNLFCFLIFGIQEENIHVLS
jgi:hypothetical protein